MRSLLLFLGWKKGMYFRGFSENEDPLFMGRRKLKEILRNFEQFFHIFSAKTCYDSLEIEKTCESI